MQPETITAYRASDGTLFESRQKAFEHDVAMRAMDTITSFLSGLTHGDKPLSRAFANKYQDLLHDYERYRARLANMDDDGLYPDPAPTEENAAASPT